MTQITKGLIVLLSIALSSAIFADSAERVLWDKTPIAVHIQQGEERIIHFPDDIRYWVPDSIQQKVSILAANGVLYIQAIGSFSATRIRVQGLNDQQVYLLDISSSEIPMKSTEMIVMTTESVVNLNDGGSASEHIEDWKVRLTRYAARQLYAPERLSGNDIAIKRTPLGIASAIPLIRSGVIEAVPIASWQAEGLTVTAIRLNNLTEVPYRLTFESPQISVGDLNLAKMIRGRWLTATVQHDLIGPKGRKDDSTVLYLVSNRSFEDSLGWMLPDGLSMEGADNG